MEGHLEAGRGGLWKWALAGAAVVSTGAVCYYAYTRFTSGDQGDGEGTQSMSEDEVGRRLRLARALQMHALPSSQKPGKAPGASSSGSSAGKSNGASSSGRKLCAECKQPLTGLPQRCSSCKTTYYCSKECQKQAWPQHKDSCKASKAAAATTASPEKPAPAPAPAAAPRSEEPAAAAPAAATAAAGEEATTTAPPAPEPMETLAPTLLLALPPAPPAPQAPKPMETMEEALASVLQESAANKTDKLEALFEASVARFLSCDYRGAIEQLLRMQGMARDEGKTSMEGEAYKWLGHSWGKLSDAGRAEAYFTEGAEFARTKGLKKLEVDCLGGLGMLCRGLNDTPRAMMFLGKALELAEELGDLDLKAGMLCNMGNVLMQVDQEQGIMALQQAVAMREQSIEQLYDQGERAGLATAVMEHATAMVNLASALYVSKKLPDAKVCYERALEVFEMVSDSDKVVKVLVNLANMCELQMRDLASSKADAAGYRERLLTFLQQHGLRVPEDTCAICLDPLLMASPSAPGKDLVMLACIHCYHDACWTKHKDGEEGAGRAVECPTCRQPVLMYE